MRQTFKDKLIHLGHQITARHIEAKKAGHKNYEITVSFPTLVRYKGDYECSHQDRTNGICNYCGQKARYRHVFCQRHRKAILYDDRSSQCLKHITMTRLFRRRQQTLVAAWSGPCDNELFIDIDSQDDLDFFIKQWEVLNKYITGDGSNSYKMSRSKSGGPRYHVTVILMRSISPLERCLLQACMGSDRQRELLSWASLDASPGCEPTCFFEKIDPLVETTRTAASHDIYGNGGY